MTPSVHHGGQLLFHPPSSSLLTAASPNTNHTNKVFTPEKEAKNGQEMIDFMHDEEYTNVDNNSEPSNACSDLVPSPSLLILYQLFKYDINDAPNSKNKSRNKHKLNESLAGDNLSDQDGNIMLPNVYFDPSSCPVPLALVHQTNKVKGAIPITGSKSKTGKNLANSMLVDDPRVAGDIIKLSVDGFSAGYSESSLQKAVQHNKDTEAILTIKKARRLSHKMTPLLSDDEILNDWDLNNTDDDTMHSGLSHKDLIIGNHEATTLEATRYVNRRSMEWKGHNQGSDDSSNNSQAKKAPAINIDLNHVCRAYNEHTGVYVCFLPQEHISETYDVCASYMLLYTLNYHRHQILVYMLH